MSSEVRLHIARTAEVRPLMDLACTMQVISHVHARSHACMHLLLMTNDNVQALQSKRHIEDTVQMLKLQVSS